MPPSEGRRKHIALKDFFSVHAPCLVMVMHGTTTHANIIVGTGLFSIYDVTSSQYLRSRKIVYMSLTVDEIRFEHTHCQHCANTLVLDLGFKSENRKNK